MVKNTLKNALLFLLLVQISPICFGQNIAVDPNFQTGTGFNQFINCSVIQSDGRIILGGGFTSFNGSTSNYITRLNSDGSLDQTFNIGTGFNASLRKIAIQSDGKIIVIGDFTSFNGVNRNYIARLNSDGSLDNSFNPGTGFNNGAATTITNTVCIQADGKILVGGSFISYNGTASNYIARINPNGSIDATFNPGTGFNYTLWSINTQADGKIIAAGLFTSFNGNAINQIARLNENGSFDPTFNPGTSFNNTVTGSAIQSDGKIVVVGAFTSFSGTAANYIARLNSNGTIDPTFNTGSGFSNGTLTTLVRSVELQSNGKIVVGGSFSSFNGISSPNIALLNTSGSFDATFLLGTGLSNGVFTTSSQPDGKIIAGGTFSNFNGVACSRVVRLEKRSVWGKVFLDLNQNCVQDTGESGLSNFTLLINPGNFVVTTNATGNWWVNYLPAGSYSVTIDTTTLNWQWPCSTEQTFTIINPEAYSNAANFGIISSNPCTDPDVSIFAPFLRPCLPNQMIYVTACNQSLATSTLSASYVDVELDPLMVITNSSLPYISLGNNGYRFQTGNLNPGQCVNFNISTTIGSPALGCASLLGQTLCMDATLYPIESCVLDTVPSNPPSNPGGGGTLNGLPQPCTLPWDQSSLSVDGWCQNDTIYFTITNTGDPGGGDMECYSPLWVTVDGVVTYTDSIMIPGAQTITYSFPGDGATWILNASQHPLHPGNSQPNAHVELCGDSTNFTPGLVNEQPLNDADPVVDIYCGTVTGSYDPNDKTGFPLGLTSENYIQPNQQIQYAIRFQNTGTDTAFTVVIRDTLDTDLNIFTVVSGVSSHPYTFKMYGPRVLEWTFDNINLPDSTTDQAGSNGFVTFHVEQLPNLSPGTEISNDADIYFDFNDPIITNNYVHRIYEGFVDVASVEIIQSEKAGVLIYPNPNNGDFSIKLNNSFNGEYRISDQVGRIVKTGFIDGKEKTVQLELHNGVYFFQINDSVVKFQVMK